MSGAELPGVFGELAPVLDRYGYGAVAVFVFLEDFGVPLPGETILIAAAVYAGAGRLNAVLLGIIAMLAAVAGDNVGYGIGHFAGRPLAVRYGRYVFLTRARLANAERLFARRGGWIVAIARFLEGLRQVNGIVAGIVRLPWAKVFLPFNALGAALWCGVWITVGYAVGSRIDVIYAQLRRYELVVAVAAGVAVLALIGWRVYRHHRRGTRATPRENDRAGRHVDRNR